MYGCKSCTTITAVLILLLGVAFLLVDWGVWKFWNLSWWTALFVIIGITKLGMNSCKECQMMRKK